MHTVGCEHLTFMNGISLSMFIYQFIIHERSSPFSFFSYVYSSSLMFHFLFLDRVFGPTTTTRHVYDVAAQHIVNGAMEGINGMPQMKLLLASYSYGWNIQFMLAATKVDLLLPYCTYWVVDVCFGIVQNLNRMSTLKIVSKMRLQTVHVVTFEGGLIIL